MDKQRNGIEKKVLEIAFCAIVKFKISEEIELVTNPTQAKFLYLWFKKTLDAIKKK